MATKPSRLRELLKKKLVISAGVFDAFSARLAERAGLEFVAMTGSGMAATMGFPDMGLVSSSEVVAQAKRIATGLSIPSICDAETGFGNALNVRRTIQDLERAGVAGVHLEDQVTPKKCGLMEGRELISTEEMVGKIKAAIEAKTDKDFVIIARTDAVKTVGIDEAIRRANAYSKAGADLIMTAEGISVPDLKKLCREASGPIVVVPPAGREFQPYPSPRELNEIGCKVVIYALEAIFQAGHTLLSYYSHLRKEGVQPQAPMISFTEYNEVLGVDELNKLAHKYQS